MEIADIYIDFISIRGEIRDCIEEDKYISDLIIDMLKLNLTTNRLNF